MWNGLREVKFLYRVKWTTSVPLRWRQCVKDGSSGLKYFILLLMANISYWHTKWLKWINLTSKQKCVQQPGSHQKDFKSHQVHWHLLLNCGGSEWLKNQELTFAMTCQCFSCVDYQRRNIWWGKRMFNNPNRWLIAADHTVQFLAVSWK